MACAQPWQSARNRRQSHGAFAPRCLETADAAMIAWTASKGSGLPTTYKEKSITICNMTVHAFENVFCQQVFWDKVRNVNSLRKKKKHTA
jgi:hypothetical protein